MRSPVWAVLLSSLVLDQSTAQLAGKLKVKGANSETCNLSMDSSSGSSATLSHSARLELQQQVSDWKAKVEQVYGRNRKYKYWITSAGGYSTGVSHIATSQNTRSCIDKCHARAECKVPGNKCLHKITSGNCECLLFSSVAYPGGRTSPAILGNAGFEDGVEGFEIDVPSWTYTFDMDAEPLGTFKQTKPNIMNDANDDAWGDAKPHTGAKYLNLKSDGEKWANGIGQAVKGPFVDGFYKLSFRARRRDGYDYMLIRIRVDDHVVGTHTVTTGKTWQHFAAFLPMKAKNAAAVVWIETDTTPEQNFASVDGSLFVDSVRLSPSDEAERSRKTTPVFWDKKANTNCKDGRALTHLISGTKIEGKESCELQKEITHASIRSGQEKCEADAACGAIMVLKTEKLICYYGAVGSALATVADKNADCFIAKRETVVDSTYENNAGPSCSPDGFALCEGKSPCVEVNSARASWIIRNEDPLNYGTISRIKRTASAERRYYKCATQGGCANMVGSYVYDETYNSKILPYYINFGDNVADVTIADTPQVTVAVCNGNKNQWFATKGTTDYGFTNGASIKEAGKPSGVYKIHVPGFVRKDLYVDNDHAGGGWVVVAKFGACDKRNFYDDGYVGDQNILAENGLPRDTNTNARLSREHINKIFHLSKYHTMRYELDTGASCVSAPLTHESHYCQKKGNVQDFDAFLAMYDARKWSDGNTAGDAIGPRGVGYNAMIENNGLPTLGNLTNVEIRVGGYWDVVSKTFRTSGTSWEVSRHGGTCQGDVTSGCQWLFSTQNDDCEDNRVTIYIR